MNIMATYFINFSGTACSLAIEKEMYIYLRETFDGAITCEREIPMIVRQINERIKIWLEHHRGKRIECSAHRGGPGYYINVGQLYMTLSEVKHEIGVVIV